MNDHQDPRHDPQAIPSDPAPREPVDPWAGVDWQSYGASGAAPQSRTPLGSRRLAIPVLLFVLTLFSTFWVGISNWQPLYPPEIAWRDGDLLRIRQLALVNWQQGLIYMSAVVLILLSHEMGHFVTTLIYRVPATVPIFLPFPFNPIGTLGAVIGMQGMLANRRQIFDIGIAGPLAGLIVAVPICLVGIGQLDLSVVPRGGLGFKLPLLMQWMISWMAVDGYIPGEPIWLSQLNPMFAAAWVGLLITGLNMIPVGQLDGGHITYCLFGRYAHLIARAAIVLAVAFMVYRQNYMLIVMVVLLLIIGTNHPPTSDDSVPLGWFRWTLGLVSLALPVLCFPPLVFEFVF